MYKSITLFTSNQRRHQNLINLLSPLCQNLYVIQEVNTVHPGKVKDFFEQSPTFQSYFTHVLDSESHIFNELGFIGNTNILSIKMGDLSMLSHALLRPALSSDVYVVFGSSWIRGWLIDYLIEQGAVNIHMGFSPHYRGSSCNFWASFDGNYQYVGATIHKLAKGLDNGDILFHTHTPLDNCRNCFDFTMNAVKEAHISLYNCLSENRLNSIPALTQDSKKQIRYTRNNEFSDKIANQFLLNLPSIEDISAHLSTHLPIRDYYNPLSV